MAVHWAVQLVDPKDQKWVVLKAVQMVVQMGCYLVDY